MASDFQNDNLDNKDDVDVTGDNANIGPQSSDDFDELSVIDISSDVEYRLNQERTGIDVVKIEPNKSTRRLNSFDLFCIRFWAAIVAAITTISDGISRGFFRLFKKELPQRYVTAAIALILIIILIIIVLAPFNLTVGDKQTVEIFSNSLIPVAEKHGDEVLWGYVNRSGRVVIPFQFMNAEPFYHNVAFVQVDNTTWRLIGTNGKFKGDIKVMTNSANPDQPIFGNFNNSANRAWIMENGKYTFIKSNGSKAFGKAYFDKVSDFSEGYAVVKQGSDCYFINKNGKKKSDRTYEDALPFSEGLAAVKKSSGWTFVNTKFKEVTEGNYDAATSFEDGYAWIRIGDTVNLIDKKGRTVLPTEFANMKPSDEQLRLLYKDLDKVNEK